MAEADSIEDSLGAGIISSADGLAGLALTDYREGRYHACIPVVLALLDGMVNDLGYHGFFSGNVDLTAWDSIRSLQQWIESTEIDPFQAA